MLPWQKQVIQLQRQSAALGTTVNVLGQLDSWVGEYIIAIEGNVTTVAATANPEGLPALLQQMRITGTLANGTPISPVNNIRGPQLAEIAQFIKANVTYSYGSLGSTGNFGTYIPCTFEHPRLGDSLRYISCLPAGTMGALNLSIQFANQNQVDTNTTPTFAATFSVGVQQNQYYASSIPAGSPYYLSTLDQVVQANPQSGSGQQQLFPNGSAYLNFLVRSMSNTNSTTRACVAKQTDAGQVPIDASTSSVGFNLQDANNVPKIQTYWGDLRKDNLDAITDSLVTGNVCFQFNRGPNAIWRPAPGSNQIPLVIPYNITGTTNPLVEFVYQRLFDPANTLQLI